MVQLRVEVHNNGDIVFTSKDGKELLFDSDTYLVEELTELLEDEGIL